MTRLFYRIADPDSTGAFEYLRVSGSPTYPQHFGL
jgi:hypothetical protein